MLIAGNIELEKVSAVIFRSIVYLNKIKFMDVFVYQSKQQANMSSKHSFYFDVYFMFCAKL